MVRIRKVEERIASEYPEGKMRCPTHLSIGQELPAVAVGVFSMKKDLAVSTHRSHAHYLAKGGSLPKLIAELYGKVTGCSRGRGGSMHLTDLDCGFIASTAIVGNTIPIGVGLGLGQMISRNTGISIVFLGDGSTEEGSFYESVNFAAVKSLPVLFVCENNLYSVYSSLSVRQPKNRDISKLAQALGIRSKKTDSRDILSCISEVKNSIFYVRNCKKPFLIEIETYRWLEHCGPNCDDNLAYRPKRELESWKKLDPLSAIEDLLLRKDMLTKKKIDLFKKTIENEIDEAFLFAESSKFASENDGYNDVFKI